MQDNPALILFAVGVSLVAAVLVLPLLGLSLFALSDGRVVALQGGALPPPGAWCSAPATGGLGPSAAAQRCWVPSWRHSGASLFGLFAAVWAGWLLSEVMVFVVAGAAGQWRGSEGVGAAAAEAEDGGGFGAAARGTAQYGVNQWQESKARVRLSLGHALGPSIGSLALAALPLASPAIFLVQALSW